MEKNTEYSLSERIVNWLAVLVLVSVGIVWPGFV
jgi:hypothetical protein